MSRTGPFDFLACDRIAFTMRLHSEGPKRSLLFFRMVQAARLLQSGDKYSVRRRWCRRDHSMEPPAVSSGDETLVGAYGQHYRDTTDRRAGGNAARVCVLPALRAA
jgi:hypothetical protein